MHCSASTPFSFPSLVPVIDFRTSGKRSNRDESAAADDGCGSAVEGQPPSKAPSTTPREFLQSAAFALFNTSHATRHTSHVTRHTPHVTRHTSRATRHTSHVTRHTSHVTRHTSHVLRHRLRLQCSVLRLRRGSQEHAAPSAFVHCGRVHA
jgi:hypothetical protein